MTTKMEQSNCGEKRFLQFNLGKDYYAVDLLLVKEVLTTPTMTPLPNSPEYVCGLFDLRGLVLMVIDLRKRFGLTAQDESEHSGTIIFDLGETLLGARVDTIQRVLNISEENIQPAPETSHKNRQYIQGIIQNENKLVMWLDPFSLVNETPKIKNVA